MKTGAKRVAVAVAIAAMMYAMAVIQSCWLWHCGMQSLVKREIANGVEHAEHHRQDR